LAGIHAEVGGVDDRPFVAGKDKLVRTADQDVVVGAAAVPQLPGPAEGAGGAAVEAAAKVKLGIGAKQESGGVKEVEVGGAAANLEEAVDRGGTAAGDASEDVLDGGVGEEGGAVAAGEVELVEAVEEVGLGLGAAGDGELGAGGVGGELGVGAVGGGGDGGAAGGGGKAEAEEARQEPEAGGCGHRGGMGVGQRLGDPDGVLILR